MLESSLGDLYSQESVGGMSLSHKIDAISYLLRKWVIRATEPGNSNLLALLRLTSLLLTNQRGSMGSRHELGNECRPP